MEDKYKILNECVFDKTIKHDNASVPISVAIEAMERYAQKQVKKKFALAGINNRLWGMFCTYNDDEGELLSVHKTEKGAIKNKKAQTDYQQNYYHTDFVVLWN